MSKTGLKAFVFSFAFTLSVVLGADRAVFHTSEPPKEGLKIPRKNIALFFSSPHPITISSAVEPVHKTFLKTPEVQSEELKIAQNIPEISEELIIREIQSLKKEDEIPLLVENVSEKEPKIEKEDIEDKLSDVPLVYAGIEKEKQSVNAAQKLAESDLPKEDETPLKIAQQESVVDMEKLSQPLIIKGTRQIIKIDNLKKREEKQQAKQEQLALVEQQDKKEEIPVQGTKQKENLLNPQEKPQDNQIASLGEDIPLVDAEKQIPKKKKEERSWQTMAEKHQNENPWLVARGSKFAKNQQILKEEFATEEAQKKADSLLLENKNISDKSARVAVQDNLLIPIPQDILDNDNLVPDLGRDNKKPPKPKKTEKKEKSFLDNITSVFSKESREKAIKKLKEKSNKLLKKEEDEEIKTPILPAEIRLSFQPNRAEISGPTLKWIQAFAKKAVDEDDVGLEIRIDGSRSFELQQKRLNLLYNILTLNQVPYQKINTLFVEREPNSFVVRTVKIIKPNQENTKKEEDGWKKYYQKW